MLTELVRNVERQHAGLVDPAADQLRRPVEEHIAEYQTHMIAKARSEKHVAETVRLITNVVTECRYRLLADLQAGSDRLEEYLAGRRQSGSSHRTVNADLIAVRSFCRWLISKKRMHQDLTEGLVRLSEDEDRRLERRSLTDGEAQELIAATFRSQRVYRHLTGEDRAVLYMLAQRTGLRRKELRSLTPASFELQSSPPVVRLRAAVSKRRKRDILPLSAELTRAVAGYLARKDRQQPVWPGSWWQRAAEMLRLDLAEAGIEPVDEDGYVLDFHGQRTTFITSLARAGVSPATAQKLARHSDINLTMGTYTRLQMEDLLVAVEKLPLLRPTADTEASVQSAENASDHQDAVDPRLGGVIRAWPNLPEHIRRTIQALVSSTVGDDPGSSSD